MKMEKLKRPLFSDISKYCKLVSEINKQNKFLNKKFGKFLGTDEEFFEFFSSDFEKLESLEKEFIDLLEKFHNKFPYSGRSYIA